MDPVADMNISALEPLPNVREFVAMTSVRGKNIYIYIFFVTNVFLPVDLITV